VAAEVARVVEGDRVVELALPLDPLHERRQQLRVVQDVVAVPVLRVLLDERVEGVRVGRNDARELVPGERRDDVLHQRLEEAVLAGRPLRVADRPGCARTP
jgi:hypothetical protein